MSLIDRIRDAVRRSALGIAGALCLAVGIAFLTAAAWIALSIAAGAVVASVVVGLAFCGAGAVALAFAQARPPHQPAPPPPAADPAPPPGIADFVVAFARGMDAGIAARKKSGE